MDELKLYETLKNAWDTTTKSTNRFGDTLNSIQWDNKFFADGEYYFVKGGTTFCTMVLNPFDKHSCPPSIWFGNADFQHNNNFIYFA